MPRFTTLYSGSSGNCAVVKAGGRFLLIDMGGSCRATVRALEGLGLAMEGLLGVLVTHEHSDHIKGLEVFLRKHPAPLLATSATLDALWDSGAVPVSAQLVEVEERCIPLGPFEVNAFPTSHDAAQSCGYRIAVEGRVMTLATDLGRMTADVFVQFEGASLVALEANYDRQMLRDGPYPAMLKRRISGATGHLCNDDAAATVAQLIGAGCQGVALCHLSEENNRPELVQKAVDAALLQAGQRLPAGCRVQIMRRYETSDWMEF